MRQADNQQHAGRDGRTHRLDDSQKPARRNAVLLDTWDAIPPTPGRFAQDRTARVIVLKEAEDQAFVPGAGISQFETVCASLESNAPYVAIGGEAGRRLLACPKPTIAMIRGFCIGGGRAIAAGCAVRIASERARFGIPAARLGLCYGASGVRKLMGLAGSSFTKEIFVTARHVCAAEAGRRAW